MNNNLNSFRVKTFGPYSHSEIERFNDEYESWLNKEKITVKHLQMCDVYDQGQKQLFLLFYEPNIAAEDIQT